LTKKPLSPKKLSIALRDHLYEVGDSLIDRKIKKGEEEENGGTPIIDNIIEEEVLWSCTTCRACEEACPVFIEYIDKIIEMRRYLVFMESRFPSELKATFKGIENNSNPWGMGEEE
jgi:Fe-S oxidoreductase